MKAKSIWGKRKRRKPTEAQVSRLRRHIAQLDGWEWYTFSGMHLLVPQNLVEDFKGRPGLGWKPGKHGREEGALDTHFPNTYGHMKMPNYPFDLNAVQRVELNRMYETGDVGLIEDYEMLLTRICKCAPLWPICASAWERCSALRQLFPLSILQ